MNHPSMSIDRKHYAIALAAVAAVVVFRELLTGAGVEQQPVLALIVALALVSVIIRRRDRGELRFDLAARATNDAIWDWDLAADRVHWNDALRARFGYDVSESTGGWWKERVHPEDYAHTLETIDDAIARGDEHWSTEYRFRRADGSWAEVFDRGYVVRDETGRSVRMLGAMLDMTEMLEARRQTEIERARLRAVLDALPVGVFIADRNGALLEVNEPAQEIWGTAPAVRGIDEYREYRGWWPNGKRIEPHEWALARALERGETSIGEIVDIESFDGRRATIMNNAAPILDAHGEIIGGVVVEVDITEQQRIERELKAAKEQAESASRAKDDFLATVSHELRTPLTAILGWSSMLRLPNVDALRDEALISIERNAKALAELIEDILDVSRIMAGKLTLAIEQLDARNVVEAAIATVTPSAQAKGVRLVSRIPNQELRVNGDPGRLQQIVWNLLANAIKFTPANGTVSVEIRQVEREVSITVTDDGHGIDPKFLPRIFDRFQQADTSTSREFGGLGLGLSIVRHLAEEHHGTVTARSEGLGYGATFEIRLPLAARGSTSEAPPALPTFACPPQLAGVHVLLVDDRSDTRDVLAALLSYCGLKVKTASGADEALAILHRDDDIKMLVSDIGMPGKNGYDLITELRQWSDMPAIALTAYARDEDRVKALEAGFQTWVAKPVEPAELLAVLVSIAPSQAQSSGVTAFVASQ